MPFEIRTLKIEDYEVLIVLWKSAGLSFRPMGRDRRDAIKRLIELDPEMFLGAFEENRLVGSVIGTFDGRRGWVNRLAVDPSYRRAGVATALVERVEDKLRDRGARMIASLVDADNTASLGLFEKNGYKVHRDILYLSKRDSDQV